MEGYNGTQEAGTTRGITSHPALRGVQQAALADEKSGARQRIGEQVQQRAVDDRVQVPALPGLASDIEAFTVTRQKFNRLAVADGGLRAAIAGLIPSGAWFLGSRESMNSGMVTFYYRTRRITDGAV